MVTIIKLYLIATNETIATIITTTVKKAMMLISLWVTVVSRESIIAIIT